MSPACMADGLVGSVHRCIELQLCETPSDGMMELTITHAIVAGMLFSCMRVCVCDFIGWVLGSQWCML